MRTVRAVVGAVLALTGSSWAVPLSAACAGAPGHVALVIDLGDEGGDLEFCVGIPEREVTGIDVIELAGDQFGLEYRLGFGGGAVCMLAGVGPEGDDCFASHPDFWGYWRGNGSGGWTWSSSGAGTSSVSSGDTEGWSWGSGMDGSTHPEPPQTSFADVCGAVAPEPGERKTARDEPSEPPPPRDAPDAEGSAAEGSAGEPVAGRSPSDARVSESMRSARARDRRSTDEPEPSASKRVDVRAVTASRRSAADPSTPVGPLAALGATAVLGAGAVAINRRRARLGR